MISKRINIYLPNYLIVALDAAAKADYVSRSAFIRESVALRLRIDDYVANEMTDKNSSLNIVKAAHFSRMINRNINKDKTDWSL
jgi:metal-responsive CopG/Arc/MetJ family transcriptional regulator